MKTLSITQHSTAEIVATATAVLRSGGLVLYPTETVYGVGVDATNPVAVQKLLAYKSRREGKPLSIAVANPTMAAEYVELNEQAKILYSQFLPGPVTIISFAKDKVAPGVASEFKTLGVRIPDYPLITELVQSLGKPITATSANASGKKRPYTIADVLDRLSNHQKQLIDLIIDAGTLPPNPPSTVIDTTLSTPLTMRQGAVAIDSAGQPGTTTAYHSNSDQETKDLAGRLLLKHYEAMKQTGLVIGLDGELGAGKTIFTKGIGNFLRIAETINSPTYSYYQEYPYQREQQTGTLYHADVWKIDTQAEFELLELSSLIKPGAILVIEWWHQIAQFLQPKLEVPVIQVTICDLGKTKRSITVTEPA